jgi:hypothetical protein
MSADVSIAADQATPAVEAPKIEPAQPDTKSCTFKDRFSPRARLGRYAVVAASITIAAALGSVAGALAGVALMRPAPETSAPAMNANALNRTLAQLGADLSSLKAAFETSSKATSTQLSRISERVERAEKAQAEVAQKAARLLDTPKTNVSALSDVTGSIAEKQQVRPPIVEGWVIRDIFDGRAMVESRFGIFEVAPGAPLPGVGKVEAIRRQDGRWVVVTPKGLIVSSR